MPTLTPTAKQIMQQVNYPWQLAGPANRKARQILMTELTGHKTPAAQCGVVAVIDALTTALEIDRAGKCQAAIDDLIMTKVRE